MPLLHRKNLGRHRRHPLRHSEVRPESSDASPSRKSCIIRELMQPSDKGHQAVHLPFALLPNCPAEPLARSGTEGRMTEGPPPPRRYWAIGAVSFGTALVVI